ncbi:MAG: hypothetical protein M0D55_05310 [Elusimicrobiota bacterium]|nr:MAG: hypothetical protein M0D55_05310 [Elusimicrobiota bacterium]
MRRILGISLCAVLLAPSARAAFQYPQTGARSAAMAGASLPSEPDAASILQNAAGAAGLSRAEVYMSYDKLYAGQEGVDSIGRSFLAGAVPTRWGSLGVAVTDFRASGLMTERVVGVSLSRRLTERLSAGAVAKYLHHSFDSGADTSGAGDPVFAGGTGRGAPSFDLGASYKATERLTVGLAARDVNSPDVGLVDEDRVPREYQAGLAWARKDWGLVATADVAYRQVPSGTDRTRMTPSLGLEKSLGDERVKFRGGVSLDQVTAGVGMQFDRFGFDYSFVMARALAGANMGSHQIGIRYRFGGNQ